MDAIRRVFEELCHHPYAEFTAYAMALVAYLWALCVALRAFQLSPIVRAMLLSLAYLIIVTRHWPGMVH